jgi:RHS repeat-associated protein
MEKDDELKGIGNSYTTEFRQYDPRIGRWLTVDPKSYLMPFQSPYNAFDNRPTITVDPRGDCPSCFSGLLAGIISEFVVQVADKMFFDGYNFESAINNVDKTDIAAAGATGFVTGFFTGGLDKISHLFKGRYGKITFRLLGELNEFVGDAMGQMGKDAMNGDDVSIGKALEQAGYDKAASVITSGKRFNLGGSKNILTRKSAKFNKEVNRAAAAKNNYMKYSKMAKEATNSSDKVKFERKAERWSNKFESRKNSAIETTVSTFSEIAGGELDAATRKGLVSKVETKVSQAYQQIYTNASVESGPGQMIFVDEK